MTIVFSTLVLYGSIIPKGGGIYVDEKGLILRKGIIPHLQPQHSQVCIYFANMTLQHTNRADGISPQKIAV